MHLDSFPSPPPYPNPPPLDNQNVIGTDQCLCLLKAKVRKTVIYYVIDAAPFWADGAAEGGIGCWENV